MTNSMSIRLVMPYDSTHSGHHTTPHLRCRRQCPCPPRARVWYMRRRQQELTRSPGQLRTSDRDPRSQHEHPMLRAHFDIDPQFQKSRTAMGPMQRMKGAGGQGVGTGPRGHGVLISMSVMTARGGRLDIGVRGSTCSRVFMVSPGAPGGVRDPCPITWVPMNIHSAATRPVSIRAGFSILHGHSGGGVEGLGKGKEEGRGDLPLFQISERSGRTACPRARRDPRKSEPHR
jgi:hypothetical protein